MDKGPLLVIVAAIAALLTTQAERMFTSPLFLAALTFVLIAALYAANLTPTRGSSLSRFIHPLIEYFTRDVYTKYHMPERFVNFSPDISLRSVGELLLEGSTSRYTLEIEYPPQSSPCDFCGSPTQRILSDFESSRAGDTIIFSDVPADYCHKCSEDIGEPLVLVPEQVASLVASLAENIRSSCNS